MEPNIEYTIRVSFDEVDYEDICDYYNAYKPYDWKPLRRLDRAEGGFYIDKIENPEDDNGAPRVNFDAVMDDIRRYFFGYVDVEDGNKPYLTFRTVEEVNRLIREKAKESRGRADDAGFSSETKKMIFIK